MVFVRAEAFLSFSFPVELSDVVFSSCLFRFGVSEHQDGLVV